MPNQPPVNEKQIASLEAQHKIVSLWLWLSIRFEAHAFPGREEVLRLNGQIIEWINTGLSQTAPPPHKAGSELGADIGAADAATDQAPSSSDAQARTPRFDAQEQPAGGTDWYQAQAVPQDLTELYSRDVLPYIKVKGSVSRVLLPKSVW